MLFAKRYNKNIMRYVYYVKCNTLPANCTSAYDLVDAVCAHFNFTEWQCSAYKSKTHKYALKVINTNTGEMLATDFTL